MPKHDEAFLENTIGAVVQAWRQHHDLTITELAARAGPPITKGYISQLERNKIRTPGDAKLVQLARALGVSVRDLVNRRLPGDMLEEGAEVETPLSHSLGPVYPALPAVDIVGDERIGRRIERLIAAALLTAEGEALVAEYLEETTERLLGFLRSAPRLS